MTESTATHTHKFEYQPVDCGRHLAEIRVTEPVLAQGPRWDATRTPSGQRSLGYTGRRGATWADDETLAETGDPHGRRVVLLGRTWAHILDGHPEMADYLDNVIDTVAHPEHHEPNRRAGRLRYFRRAGPERWIRVVSELSGDHDRIVTAFPQSNDPAGWRA